MFKDTERWFNFTSFERLQEYVYYSLKIEKNYPKLELMVSLNNHIQINLHILPAALMSFLYKPVKNIYSSTLYVNFIKIRSEIRKLQHFDFEQLMKT